MIKRIRAEWEDAILVCGKCSKRVGGGFGEKGRTPLAKLLRKAGLGDRRRRARRGVVEVGCLKVCPKNAVVAVATRPPLGWVAIPAGAPLSEIVTALGLHEPVTPPPPPPSPSPPPVS